MVGQKESATELNRAINDLTKICFCLSDTFWRLFDMQVANNADGILFCPGQECFFISFYEANGSVGDIRITLHQVFASFNEKLVELLKRKVDFRNHFGSL